jgi:hypothetical protein
MKTAQVNLSKIGLALLSMDRMYLRAKELLDSIGLGHRTFISESEDDNEYLSFKVSDLLEEFPCHKPLVWAELLERTRRIHGELEKCEALIALVKKSFPRNTTKEPL